jgi:hypothetical protein
VSFSRFTWSCWTIFCAAASAMAGEVAVSPTTYLMVDASRLAGTPGPAHLERSSWFPDTAGPVTSVITPTVRVWPLPDLGELLSDVDELLQPPQP